ncbi:MAG: archease family protein [Microgenomates group bacterium LiPW_16]|nr:MAG: archease family protein [Microgenomates group bacterium LiPW_16]
MIKFRFLEDIATADVAFEAYGKTPDELFENCGLALEEVMVDTKTLQKSKVKGQKAKLQLKSQKLEDLLYDFLSEMVFLKDRDGLLFSKFEIKIKPLTPSRISPKDASSAYTLVANLSGEPIDPSHHHLRADVKAVTKHLFALEKEKEGYKATVILDI